MSDLDTTLRGPMRALFERPDELLLDVGAAGEQLTARVRVALLGVLMLLPGISLALGGDLGGALAGWSGVVPAFLASLLWLALARHARRLGWLPFLTAGFDASATTLALVLLSLQEPAAGLNSTVVFPCYLLAIMGSTLRLDGRVTLFAGAMAVLQYGLLAAVVLAIHPPEALVSPGYGQATLAAQAQRLLLLALAVPLCAVVVYRMQAIVRASGRDGLTGLPNRTQLSQRLPTLLEDARDGGHTLSVALVDVDHLRRLNELHGHPAGDAALVEVARRLRGMLGQDECAIRIGGEEFLLVLQGPLGQAYERVEAVRRAVATQPFVPSAGEPGWPLDFSAGLAAFPHDAAELSGLLRRADQRVRLAKAAGRGRSVARDG